MRGPGLPAKTVTGQALATQPDQWQTLTHLIQEEGKEGMMEAVEEGAGLGRSVRLCRTKDLIQASPTREPNEPRRSSQ